jgi:hypothetical protein
MMIDRARPDARNAGGIKQGSRFIDRILGGLAFDVGEDEDVAQGGEGTACAWVFLDPFGAKSVDVKCHLDSQVRAWMIG